MLKALSVFGTRPEAIKMAPVVREMAARPQHIIHRVCVTAQHRQMLEQVLHLFGIVPDHNLNVMRDHQTPTQVAAATLAGLAAVLEREQPDWVLVQGDTTTAMAAALAAFYAGARVGHVEAGLRTFQPRQPFPEEINRRVVTAVAEVHFAPTPRARQNLLHEGIGEAAIRVTGNTVIDALHWAVSLPYAPDGGLLQGVDWNRRLLLVTAHRRENLGPPLERICRALRDIALAYPDDVGILFPAHLNPDVQEPARRLLAAVPNIWLTAPLDYLPLVWLMQRCFLTLTDSGGIQEEAAALGKPTLVLREVTERPEGIDAGAACLVGTHPARIVEWTRRLLDNPAEYARMAQPRALYGDGKAAQRIVDTLLAMETI